MIPDDDGNDNSLTKSNGCFDTNVTDDHVLVYNAAEAVGTLIECIRDTLDYITDLHATMMICVAGDDSDDVGNLVNKLIMFAESSNGGMLLRVNDDADAVNLGDDIVLTSMLVGEFGKVNLTFTKNETQQTDGAVSLVLNDGLNQLHEHAIARDFVALGPKADG